MRQTSFPASWPAGIICVSIPLRSTQVTCQHGAVLHFTPLLRVHSRSSSQCGRPFSAPWNVFFIWLQALASVLTSGPFLSHLLPVSPWWWSTQRFSLVALNITDKRETPNLNHQADSFPECLTATLLFFLTSVILKLNFSVILECSWFAMLCRLYVFSNRYSVIRIHVFIV